MEIGLLFGLMAVLAGFAAAYCAAEVGMAAFRRHRAAAAMQDGSKSLGSLLAWRLRNGFGFVLPLARIVLRIRPVSQLAQVSSSALKSRGMASAPDSLVSVVLVITLAIGLLAWLLLGSPIAAAALMASAFVAAAVLASSARDKRQEAMREAIPDALESMTVCFGSGFTLLQTFRQVSEDVQGPLGNVFGRCGHMLEIGASAQSALEELRKGAQASELAFVAVALDVQHQSGGAMRQVLDAATDAVKGELALRRSLRVQTAQAKLSARVVSVMPLVLVTAFSLASPDYLMPFFSSPYGYAMLALAVVMQVVGILLVRKALSVEGVS